MTPSKRPPRRLDAVPPPRNGGDLHPISTARSRRPKVAKVVIYDQHAEFTMLGFEAEDLDALKDSVPMRWDRDDRVWVVHWRDVDDLLDALRDNDFAVRLREVS